MSFKSNIGKPHVDPAADQCEMIDVHHPDCTCASCKMMVDPQCLEPFVGTVPENGDIRVCGACAMQQEREEFIVAYRPETRFVITHPEMGIYLGAGGWSKANPERAANTALTFANRVMADLTMSIWLTGRPDKTAIWPVLPDRDFGGEPAPASTAAYASVTACVAAGLDAWAPAT